MISSSKRVQELEKRIEKLESEVQTLKSITTGHGSKQNQIAESMGNLLNLRMMEMMFNRNRQEEDKRPFDVDSR